MHLLYPLETLFIMSTFKLTDSQQAACQTFMEFLLDPDATYYVLTGYSGCGKTTLIKYFKKLVETNKELLNYILPETAGNIPLVFTATTHKAATNLSEHLGGHETQTIHSYLKLRIRNDFTNGKTVLYRGQDYTIKENTVLFIDEGSMIDDNLLRFIKQSVKRCKVIIIGDPKQLLGVFAKDAPALKHPTYYGHLNKVVRQAANSSIIQVATDIRDSFDKKGILPFPETNEIIHLSGPEFREKVIETMGDPGYDKSEYKILGWTNNKVQAYNSFVRELHTNSQELFPGEVLVFNSSYNSGQGTIPAETYITVMKSEPEVRLGIEGQRVTTVDYLELFVANDYQDIVKRIRQAQRDKNWHDYFMYKDGFPDVRSPNAQTVHKSQGSTIGNVFLDLTDIGSNNKYDEVLRLIYVGITRAANKLYLYGNLPSRYYR